MRITVTQGNWKSVSPSTSLNCPRETEKEKKNEAQSKHRMIRARCVWSRGRGELVLGVQVMVRGCLSLTSKAPASSTSSCFYRVASAITGFASSQSSLSSIPYRLLSSLLWEGQYTLFLWQTTTSEFCMRLSTFPLWTWFIISDTFIKTKTKKTLLKQNKLHPPAPRTQNQTTV